MAVRGHDQQSNLRSVSHGRVQFRQHGQGQPLPGLGCQHTLRAGRSGASLGSYCVFFECIAAGTSAGSEPTPAQTNVNFTFVDSGATWIIRAMPDSTTRGDIGIYTGVNFEPLIYPAGLTREAQLLLGAGVVAMNILVYGFVLIRWVRRRRLRNVSAGPGDRSLCHANGCGRGRGRNPATSTRFGVG